MADEVTHQQKLGSFADFKAPWETEAGEVDIDKGKLKQYLYNGALDKAKAQDRAEAAEGKVEAAETAKTEAVKAQKAAERKAADADSTGQIAELTEKVTAETARANKAEGNLLKLEVGDAKGLSAAQSLRLQGDTKEEIEKDADAIVELFGLKAPANEDDEDEEDEEEERDTLRVSPRLSSGRGADAGAEVGPTTEADFEKAIAGSGLGSRIL